jgi:hypothetical protein
VNLELEQRFRANISTTPNHAGCLDWLGCRQSHNGRGLFWDGERQLYAHRVVYQLATGEPPGKLFIVQTCGNPLCVNPSHLAARPPRRIRPNRNNRRSGVLGVSPAGSGWRGKRLIDGFRIDTKTFPTIAEAEEALHARVKAGPA